MQRLVEGGLAVEPAEDSQEQECQGEAHDQQPRNVAAREMAELVREDRSISEGVSRSMSVSKKTMRLLVPNPVKYALRGSSAASRP